MFSWPLSVLLFALFKTVFLTGGIDVNPSRPPGSCKLPKDLEHPPPADQSFDYNHYFSRCIDIVAEPATWDMQYLHCWNRQADLEAPRNDSEVNAFYNLAFWLYSEHENPAIQLWVGARWNAEQKNFLYSRDNTTLTAGKFEDPDNGKGECLALNLWAQDVNNEERWSRVDCNTLLPAICFELKGDSTHPTEATPSTPSTAAPNTTISTTTPSPTSSSCSTTPCTCSFIPLCAQSDRCDADECIVGDTCYSALNTTSIFTGALATCKTQNRTLMTFQTDSDAYILFSFISTDGECSQRGADAKAVFDAVWVSMMYGKDGKAEPYNATKVDTNTKFAAYFTMTDCMVKLNAPALFKASEKQVARYAACQRAADPAPPPPK